MSNEVYKILLSIVGTLIPTVIIFVYLCKNVRFSRYKFRWMLYLVFCGVGAASFSPYLTELLSSFWKDFMKAAHIYNKTSYNFVRATFCVAFSEEFFKCALATMAAFIVLDLDSRYDALFCSGVTALGFAITENFYYVYDYGLYTAISRTFTAVPMHVADGIIFGYFLSKMGFFYYKGYKENIKNFYKYFWIGMFWVVLSHGIYDFLLFQETAECQMIHRIFVIMMYVFILRLVYRVSKGDANYNKVKVHNDEQPEEDTEEVPAEEI